MIEERREREKRKRKKKERVLYYYYKIEEMRPININGRCFRAATLQYNIVIIILNVIPAASTRAQLLYYNNYIFNRLYYDFRVFVSNVRYNIYIYLENYTACSVYVDNSRNTQEELCVTTKAKTLYFG